MERQAKPKRHPSSQIAELTSTAVQNALARRGRVLSSAELEAATGGVQINELLDWEIRGGLRARLLQDAFDVNQAKGFDQLALNLRQF